MAKIQIGSNGSARSWQDGEKFAAMYMGTRTEQINGDAAKIVMFAKDDGELVERWETKLWDRLANGEKRDGKKIPPVIKQGTVLAVEVGTEKKLKGGKRFRQFSVEILTGKDIPKRLR